MILASQALVLTSMGSRIRTIGILSPLIVIILVAVVLLVIISVTALSRAHRHGHDASNDGPGEFEVIGRFPPIAGDGTSAKGSTDQIAAREAKERALPDGKGRGTPGYADSA